ncbi:MAG: hypothetical protein PWQ95_1977 [Thermococcaceae archaeon]|nr:hypothetical protein [Thermococcaceae archaeon]
MVFKKSLSWEEKTTLKIVLVMGIIFISVYVAALSPILFHEDNPFRVLSPKGRLMVAENLTFNGVKYTNAVFIQGGSPTFTFMGSENNIEDVKIKVLTEGWCVDLWRWEGIEKGWGLIQKCSKELSLDYYSFSRAPTRESGVVYWRLERGYIFVFYKEGPVQHYEEVRFKVEYAGKSDEGYFVVSLGKSQ